MSAQTDQQPWAPDPDVGPGTPPVDGEGGERGTSAFDGNDDWNFDYTPVDPALPVSGPGIGTSYHTSQYPVVLGTWGGAGRSTAGTHELYPTTAGLTADDETPSAAAPVTLTAPLSSTADVNWSITGTVAFKEGATTLGTVAVTGGVAVYVHAAGFAAGEHVITAVYSGSTHYATATSASLTVTAT